MSSMFLRHLLLLPRRTNTSATVLMAATRAKTRIQPQQQFIQRTLSSSNKSKRRKSSCTLSSFSTAAATAVEDHQDVEESQSSSSSLSIQNSRNPSHTPSSSMTAASPKTPRLDALRHRLKTEQQEQFSKAGRLDHQQTTTTIPFITKSHGTLNQTSSFACSTVEEPTDDSEELEQVLKQLELLPPVPLQHKHSSHPYPSTVDRFGRHHTYLRISLSERCNLRCLYCMPADGVPLQPESHLLSNDEIVQLSQFFVTYGGITKLRLTGGEPLLRKDLAELIQRIQQATTLNGGTTPALEQIGMTTNGVTLSKQLPELIDVGLTHVNISLDSLDPAKFSKLTRRPTSYFDRVWKAIEDCATLLPNRTKINCVVMPENVNELQDFCKLTQHMPIDVRFIEYMPFNSNQWGTDGFVSYAHMQDQLEGQLQRLEDGPNDTTKWWTWNDSSSASSSQGRIGFITSMTDHFCSTCNRLRITADGKLKVCLFGTTEVSLRDILRRRPTSEIGPSMDPQTEEWLAKVVYYTIQRKHFKLGGHADMQDLSRHSTENRPMTLIGG